MSEIEKTEITREDLERRKYGRKPYDPHYCGESVPLGDGAVAFRQCASKPRPGSLWCGLHAPLAQTLGSMFRWEIGHDEQKRALELRESYEEIVGKEVK